MGLLRRTPGDRTDPAGGSTARRSVYEQRCTQARPDDEVQWTPVGEFDDTGRFITRPGWERGGWKPLGDFMRER